MLLFQRAVLAVGPHGAGLSNLIYCEPGTYVIEGLCNPPHLNMCFQWATHILGHLTMELSQNEAVKDLLMLIFLSLKR